MVSVRQETTAPILRKNIKAPGPALLNPPVLKNKIACSPIERRNRGPIMDHYLGLDTRDYGSELQGFMDEKPRERTGRSAPAVRWGKQPK
jgi:hypothetical protein